MTTHRERLLVAVSSVAEVFNRGLSDVSLALYAEAMAAWPVEAVEGSVLEVVRASRFMPSPAEWGEYAAEWWRAEQARRREERLSKALAEYVPMTEEQRAAAEVRAKALRDELAERLGWHEARMRRENDLETRRREDFWDRVEAAKAIRKAGG